MRKLKTHKGIARRIKVTGSGKVLRFRVGRRHLLTGKSARSKRHLRRPAGLPLSARRMLKRFVA